MQLNMFYIILLNIDITVIDNDFNFLLLSKDTMYLTKSYEFMHKNICPHAIADRYHNINF